MSIKLDVKIPTRLRLKIDADDAKKKVGQKTANKVRRAMRSGTTYDGASLTPSLQDTGRLIRSIKYNRRTGRVEPTGKRPDGNGISNFGLLIVHITQQQRRGNGSFNPMGTGSEQLAKDLAERFQEQIAKQLKSGRASLIGELRRVR